MSQIKNNSKIEITDYTPLQIGIEKHLSDLKSYSKTIDNNEPKKVHLNKKLKRKFEEKRFKSNNNLKNNSSHHKNSRKSYKKNNSKRNYQNSFVVGKSINNDSNLSISKDINKTKNIIHYRIKANEKYGSLFSNEDIINNILLFSNENNSMENNILHSKTNQFNNIYKSPVKENPKNLKLSNNLGSIIKITPMKNIEIHKRQKTSVLDRSNNNYNLNIRNGMNSPTFKNRDNIKLSDYLFHKKNNSSNNNISINDVSNKTLQLKNNSKDKLILNKEFNKNQIIYNQKKEIESLIKENNLSGKEKAFLILSKSPVLRLRYQLIFAHSTPTIRKIISNNSILDNYDNIFKLKIDELKRKIAFCDKKLEQSFKASKTAEITFNFISSLDEAEFMYISKLFRSKEHNYTESEINYYYNYIALIYLLFNKKLGKDMENVERERMKLLMYDEVHKRGFSGIKDCLYQCFISNSTNISQSMILVGENYDKISGLIRKAPEILKYNKAVRMCKFTCYSFYLIKEVLSFADKMDDAKKLKIKVRNLLNLVNRKYEIYQSSYKNRAKKDL